MQGSLGWGGTSTNVSNAYTITLPITPTFFVGQLVRFLANASNTATATITINGTTFNLIRPDGTQLQTGDIIAGSIVSIFISSLAPNKAILYTPPAQFVNQQDPQNYAVDTGAANAYAVSLTPTPISPYTAGFPIRFLVANTNTAASTLNVNGTGAVAITRATTNALVPNDLLAGGIFEVVFNGSNWQLTSVSGGLLQPQEIFGISGGLRGTLQVPTNVTIGSTLTPLFPSPVSLTMPNKGTAWAVHFTSHVRTQMLSPTDTTGSTTTVQLSITDGTVTEAVSDATSLSTANNQTKFVNIHGVWISPSYTPNTTQTFQLEAIATVTGTAPQPVAVAGATSYYRWTVLSSS
jgi:hypothetical protein